MRITFLFLSITFISLAYCQSSSSPFNGGIGDGFSMNLSSENLASDCELSGFNLGEDLQVCPNTIVNLIADEMFDAKFLWSTGDTSREIEVTESGNYFVTASLGACSFSDSITIDFYPEIETQIKIIPASDEFISDGAAQVKITSSETPLVNYYWETGSTEKRITNMLPGSYNLILKDSLTQCEKYLEITIPFDSCKPAINLTAVDSAVDQIFVSWEGSSSDLEYQLVYFIPSTGESGSINTGTSNTVLIPLISTSKIKFYVNSICAGQTYTSAVLEFTSDALRQLNDTKQIEINESKPFIAPNPVSDILYLMNVSSAKNNILIFDAAGNKLFAEERDVETDNSSIKIDVKDFPAGSYTVQISNSNETVILHYVKLN